MNKNNEQLRELSEKVLKDIYHSENDYETPDEEFLLTAAAVAMAKIILLEGK